MVSQQLTPSAPKSFVKLAWDAVDRVLAEHELLGRSSSIAWSAMMAFVPFLMLVMTIGAHLLPNLADPSAVGIGNITAYQVTNIIQALIPGSAADIVASQIAHVQGEPPLAMLSLTALVCLWTASNLYARIIQTLDRIYGGGAHSRSFLRERFLAIGLVVLQITIVFVCMLLIVGFPFVTHFVHWSKLQRLIANVLNWSIVFIAIFTSFAIMFKVGPHIPGRKRWSAPGALFGTLAFMGLTYAFRVYVQNFGHYQAIYGSFGGVIILMFWVWLMSVVFLVAAEMNQLADATVREEVLTVRVRNTFDSCVNHLLLRHKHREATGKIIVAPAFRQEGDSESQIPPENF